MYIWFISCSQHALRYSRNVIEGYKFGEKLTRIVSLNLFISLYKYHNLISKFFIYIIIGNLPILK